jgi:hypothetical protein
MNSYYARINSIDRVTRGLASLMIWDLPLSQVVEQVILWQIKHTRTLSASATIPP